METQNTFATQVAANEKAQAHAQEIQQTRIGGLGGSDASLLLKIGQKGMAALSATDHKRLCVMLGMMEQQDFSNAYTKAGHAFEDWAESYIPFKTDNHEREKVLSAPLALNFKTFAHADFYDDGTVVECKFVRDTTQGVAIRYNAQLQWYYLMGAKQVVMFHGLGSPEPFEVDETFIWKVDRDDDVIDFLLAGIKILDDALSAGWRPEIIEKCELQITPNSVQEAFASLVKIQEKEKALAEAKAAAQLVVLNYMQDFEFVGIRDSISGHNITYNKAGVTRTFDAKKLAADHPELSLEKYYKTSTRKASITLK